MIFDVAMTVQLGITRSGVKVTVSDFLSLVQRQTGRGATSSRAGSVSGAASLGTLQCLLGRVCHAPDQILHVRVLSLTACPRRRKTKYSLELIETTFTNEPFSTMPKEI